MGIISKLLGIEKLEKEIKREREKREELEKKLDMKYDNLTKFSIILRNADMADLKFKVEKNSNMIKEIITRMQQYVKKEDVEKILKSLYPQFEDKIVFEVEEDFEEFELPKDLNPRYVEILKFLGENQVRKEDMPEIEDLEFLCEKGYVKVVNEDEEDYYVLTKKGKKILKRIFAAKIR